MRDIDDRQHSHRGWSKTRDEQTRITMDIHCGCASPSHVIENFVVPFVQCPHCDTVYYAQSDQVAAELTTEEGITKVFPAKLEVDELIQAQKKGGIIKARK